MRTPLSKRLRPEVETAHCYEAAEHHSNRPSPRGPKRLAPPGGETERLFVETSNFDGEYLENGTSEKSEVLHDDRDVRDEQKSFGRHFSYVSSFGAVASRRFRGLSRIKRNRNDTFLSNCDGFFGRFVATDRREKIDTSSSPFRRYSTSKPTTFRVAFSKILRFSTDERKLAESKTSLKAVR